jgi:hypothetical protein
MELFEDAGLVLCGNARASICYADGKVAVCGLGTHSYLSGVGEFDGVPNKVEQHLSVSGSSYRKAKMRHGRGCHR